VTDALFDSLFAALAADPANNQLRVQVAALLLERGRASEAVAHAGQAVAHDPADAAALEVLSRATTALQSAAGIAAPVHPIEPQAAVTSQPGQPAEPHEFDWSKAESELNTTPVPPPFVEAPGSIRLGDDSVAPVVDEYTVAVTLADVGGLEPVKQRLRESFLEPMRHPELAKAFGKTLRGGLVLYGPPGCGKTFMARAIAGELGARFLTASVSDILGTHFGETEKNLHALFEKARSLTPAVLFLDEIDAIGARRSSIGTGWSGMRAMVDQLLMELDSMAGDNDGLFVLAATNSPWEVDPALLRPGRLDRMLLVLPPDEPAREAILRMHLERRPIAGIDLRAIVARTEGFSGADLEHLVASAAEQAMLKSIAAGQVQPIGMAEIDHVLKEIRPSTGAWLSGAKNVATFANTDGRYDDLVAYLKARGLL
jgi:AAA+ superfamily predicted ATPase